MVGRRTVLMRLRALGRRCSRERGYTLIELVTAMGILSTVVGTLVVLFVAAAKAELDLNTRYQAQHTAALALNKLRRDIHCASEATTSAGGDAVTLTLEYFCPTGAATVTWCTAEVATERFRLFRAVDGSCDDADVQWADYLTQGALFSFEHPAGSLAKVGVVLPVDLNPGEPPLSYELEDALVLRNSERAA